MKTIAKDGAVHILGGVFQGGFSVQCGKIYHGSKPDTRDAAEVTPTCPECLRRHFSRLKTNYYYQKKAEKAQKRTSRLMNGLSLLIDFQQTKHADNKCEESSKGAYPFIPMGTSSTIATFEWLHETLKKEKRWSGHSVSETKFLDAGCGIGNIMLLARICRLAHAYHGIEFFEETANRARTWLGTNNERSRFYKPYFEIYKPYFEIFQDDILTFPNYSDYDIVYFYCPLCEARLQIRFEERLEDEMKVGAVLIPRLKRGRQIHQDDRFERISKGGEYGDCFIKVKDGKRRRSDIKKIDKDFKSNRKSDYNDRIKKQLKAGTLKV